MSLCAARVHRQAFIYLSSSGSSPAPAAVAKLDGFVFPRRSAARHRRTAEAAIRHIRARQPKAPIAITTGALHTGAETEGSLIPFAEQFGVGIFEKPFRQAVLASYLRRGLASAVYDVVEADALEAGRLTLITRFGHTKIENSVRYLGFDVGGCAHPRRAHRRFDYQGGRRASP